MPRYLTIASFAVAGWTIGWSENALTGFLPALVVFASALASFTLWSNRGEPWHDRDVILSLLPAIAAGVWVATGGLVLDVERTDGERLAFEVGPGVALTGLLCTLVSYHGRHHPSENEDGRREDRPS
jgi:hypothetical protein